MGEIASAFVSIVPSMRGFGSTVTKESQRAGATSGRTFGNVFAKSTLGPLRTFGALAAGIFAVDKAKDFFQSSIAEARESQQVSKLTAQVIKSTGGAAQVSAKQVGNLATAISNKVGVDDEAIQSGENLLLTFKNIRNEQGRGNDIFNQTSQAAVDMTAAMNKGKVTTEGLKGSAIQLGKALNDPAKGLTALQRVGVTFTDQQKKQIAALVKSGNVVGAQKVILKEVKSEFGGAAAASTTMGQKVSVAWLNIKESIGRALLPALDAAEKALLTGLFPAFRGAGNVVRTYVVPAMQNVAQFIKSNVIPAFQSFASQAGPALLNAARDVATFFRADVLPVLTAVWQFIATKLAPAVGSVLKTAFAAFSSVLHKVGGTIQAHRAELSELLGGIRKLASFILTVAVPVLKVALKTAFAIAGTAIRLVIRIIALAVDGFNDIVGAGRAVADFFTGPFLHGVGLMVSVFTRGVKFLADAALSAFGVIVHGGATMLGWVPGIGGKLKQAASAFDAFKNKVDSTLSGIANDAAKWGTRSGQNFSNNYNRAINLHNPIGGGGNTRSGDQNHNGGQGGHILTDSHPTVVVHVHNPVPEKASDSVPKRLREAAYVHGLAWAG